METDADRRAVLRAIKRHLAPAGRLIFDVFAPAADDIEDTHGRWIEREPGIWERADWNEDTRTLVLRVRDATAESEMSLAWLSMQEWRQLLAEEGFEVEALYGWFDRSPWAGNEDSIWICRLPT
jgi:SAM-dependent methyltransferase